MSRDVCFSCVLFGNRGTQTLCEPADARLDLVCNCCNTLLRRQSTVAVQRFTARIEESAQSASKRFYECSVDTCMRWFAFSSSACNSRTDTSCTATFFETAIAAAIPVSYAP